MKINLTRQTQKIRYETKLNNITVFAGKIKIKKNKNGEIILMYRYPYIKDVDGK